MSIQAVAWALEQKVEDPAAKLVLISLANAYNQQRHRCFPTVRQIMTEAGVSESSARRKVQLLADLGLVRIEKSFDSTGRQQANEYILSGFGEGVKLKGGGCQIDRGEGVRCDRGEGVSCETPLKEPEEIPEEGSLGASAPREPAPHDRFEEFWSTFPKREGPNPKKPARLKFTRLVANGANAETIISAAKALAKHHPKPTRFCPQAVTWLNQERFADAEVAPSSKPAFVPKVPSNDDEWAKMVQRCRLQHQWPAYLGPSPMDEGCKAPDHLLTAKDRREYWRIMQVAS